MTLASQGIGARLERGNQDSESLSNPYAVVYDERVVARAAIFPPPSEYMDRPLSNGGLAVRRLSLTALGLKKPAPPPSAAMMSRFPPTRLSGPVQFVLRLLDYWRLSRDDAASLLGFDATDSDYVEDVLNGMASFRGRDARDRIAHLFHVWATLSSLFQDKDVENDWLRESHALLDAQSPLSLLLDGAMENLLLVKEYVDAAAGH